MTMPTVPSPQTVLDRVRRDVERNALRARNGIKLVAGVDRPGVGQTPKDVVWQRGRTQLWHYRNDPHRNGEVRYGPPLLIVFSLISRSYILDLTPGNSFVEQLLDAGFDVYLLDWGEPDERDAGNKLEDYVDDYIPAGIERVLELSGADEVNLFGYCFGGDLTLLYAAHHPDAPLRSLTVLATPVDFRHLGPLADIFSVGRMDVSSVLDRDGNVPPSIVVQGFRTLTPTAEVTRYVSLWERLWNDEYVASYHAMTG
jgi:polyhydroxyalkanoate synthase subunit PhaC